jgi:ATP-binding cassette subfamily C protein CydD
LFISSVGLGFASGALVILQALLLGRVITAVFLESYDLAGVQKWLLMLLGIAFVRAVAGYLGEVSSGTLAVRIKTRLRQGLMDHLFELGPGPLRYENSGEIITTVTQGVEQLDAYFSQYLPQVILAALIPLTILAVVFPIDLLSGIILLLTAPLIPIFMILIGKGTEAVTNRQYLALSRLGVHFLDTLQGLRELKLFGQSKAQSDRLQASGEKYRAATMTVLRVAFLSALALELVGTISTAVIAVQIGLRLLYGHLQFEQAFFILIIAPEFYLPLRLLGQRFHAGISGITAAKRIFAFLEIPAHKPDRAMSSVEVENVTLNSAFTIHFDNVRVVYPGRRIPALHDASFKIHSGEITAMVGSSGAGKTTILNLLLGFIQPQEGKILVNGLDLDSISRVNWNQQIAWVPQEPYLFNDTIAANIAFGKPEASIAEIKKAAGLARLSHWIEQLPDGYATRVGEGGVLVSGGEAQRIALARAFCKDSPFLLLDEPTSHLDPDLEADLEVVTRQLMAGRTVLVIAHRLATVYNAHKILAIENGTVVEQGTHASLAGSEGIYATLLSAYGGSL